MQAETTCTLFSDERATFPILIEAPRNVCRNRDLRINSSLIPSRASLCADVDNRVLGFESILKSPSLAV